MRRADSVQPAEVEWAPSLTGNTPDEVARLLGLTVTEVRRFLGDGFLEPRVGADGQIRLSFRDVVLLRTAKELRQARVPTRRIRLALKRLREQLPSGRPLTALRIRALGSQVVVQDGGRAWNPESGQRLLDFAVADLAEEVAPLVERRGVQLRQRAHESVTAQEWYELGCDLERTSAEEALRAYRRALAADPGHLDAALNLGRCLHEAGKVEEAESYYRQALEIRPQDPTAAFNLGVALEDLERSGEALDAYELAIAADPDCADAHFNAARLYEERADAAAALRHLKAYRRLQRADG